jgi:hypothetical protein
MLIVIVVCGMYQFDSMLFVQAALPKLEAAPHVHRYSWFQTWQKNTPSHPGKNPGCSLTTTDGKELTILGEFYSNYLYPEAA